MMHKMAKRNHTKPTDVTVGSVSKRAKWLQKPLIIFLAAILVIGVIGVGLWYRNTRNKTPVPTIRVACTDNTLAAAASVLAPADNKQLQPIVEQIRNTEGFTEDPNCLYVVLTYYINVSDPNEARRYFTDLEKVYNPEVGYNEIITPGSLSLEQLGATVVFLEQQKATVNDTQFYAPAGPRP